MAKEQPAKVWGKKATQVYADLRDREVVIAFRDGSDLRGKLVGLDTYEFVVERDGVEIAVQKGSVRSIHGAEEGD